MVWANGLYSIIYLRRRNEKKAVRNLIFQAALLYFGQGRRIVMGDLFYFTVAVSRFNGFRSFSVNSFFAHDSSFVRLASR